VIVSLALAPVLAGAKDSFRIEYFALHGSTARELRADLKRLGPVGDTGIRGDAYTEYRIAWRFSMNLKDGVCRASDVVVDLEVTMRLPSWVPPPEVAAQLLTNWDRFSEVLREHEDGHHRIAISAAREVRRKLRKRTRAASCEALKAKLNATVNEVLLEYRNRQHDFDLETDYGRAQGTGVL
jgi:predicted secreted Zn-dependent protease